MNRICLQGILVFAQLMNVTVGAALQQQHWPEEQCAGRKRHLLLRAESQAKRL
jgi:hypothetical protein